MPNKVKKSLEKSYNIKFTDDKLALFINDCINIENNIKDINKVNEIINKFKNDTDIEIKFEYGEQLNIILEYFKTLGNISVNDEIIIDSIINKDINKQKEIIKWIKQKTNQNIIKFEKLFTMSINGNSAKDFHYYCDNKGPTLIFIKTTKNKIFGGFTPLSWDSDTGDKYDKDEQTFLFSLNSMKKFDKINKEKADIYCCSKNGPYLGGYYGRDFSIETDMKIGTSFANKYAVFLSNNNLDLTGGKGEKETFDIEDFEVFKVNY